MGSIRLFIGGGGRNLVCPGPGRSRCNRLINPVRARFGGRCSSISSRILAGFSRTVGRVPRCRISFVWAESRNAC